MQNQKIKIVYSVLHEFFNFYDYSNLIIHLYLIYFNFEYYDL